MVYSPRRRANNCGTGIIESRAFCPSSELSSHRIFHRVSFFLSLLTHFSPFIFLPLRAPADNSIFPCLRETRPRLAYLWVTVQLFENRKTRQKPRKIERNDFHELQNPRRGNEFIEGVHCERLAEFLICERRDLTSSYVNTPIRLCISEIKERRRRKTVINLFSHSAANLFSLLSFFSPNINKIIYTEYK